MIPQPLEQCLTTLRAIRQAEWRNVLRILLYYTPGPISYSELTTTPGQSHVLMVSVEVVLSLRVVLEIGRKRNPSAALI